MPPLRLNDKITAVIVKAFTEGATIRIAAGVARLHPETLGRWLRRGHLELAEWSEAMDDLEPGAPEPEQTLHAKFFLAAAEAIATRDLRWIRKIDTGDTGVDDRGKPKDWTRYAWLLERTAPGEFALRDGVRRVEITGPDGGPMRTATEVSLNANAVALILANAGYAGVAQPEDGDSGPRKALPAAPAVLAESGEGEPAAGGVPAAPVP